MFSDTGPFLRYMIALQSEIPRILSLKFIPIKIISTLQKIMLLALTAPPQNPSVVLLALRSLDEF